MTPEQESKVLGQLYDRLYDAVTYAPPGKGSAFPKQTTFIQMAKNTVLDPDDFKNMFGPANPGGDANSLQLFSLFCDAQPSTDALWSPTGGSIAAIYSAIVNGANTSDVVDPKQKDIYDQAFGFLNQTTSTKNFKGDTVTAVVPSPVALAYDQAQAAYITAVGGFRNAYNGYDLTKIPDQRAWNAVAPGLQLNVDQTWNAWGRAGKAEVDEAQQALASTINDALTAVITSSQALVGANYQMASSTGAGTFLPCYAIPTNWADPSSGASHLHFDSSNMSKEESAEASSYSASANGGWGLWSAGGGVSGSSQDEHTHMETDAFTLDADLVFVQIKRPWLNTLLFGMKGWWVKGLDANGISDGNPDSLKGTMPLLPTGFVIARNVSISANFGAEDMKFHADQVSTQATAGWGPFSVSGSYSHSSSDRKFTSSMSGGKLTFEGLQVIAWISQITPASPPLAAPAG